MICLDHNGELMTYASQSVKLDGVFTSEVRQNFLSILGESIDYQQSSPRGLKRRKSEASATSAFEMALDERDIENLPTGSTKAVLLTIGEKRNITEYYVGALTEFGQLSCRTLARAFIKFIEPHKRSKYPYNGGKPPPGSTSGTKRDPEKTKPKWWPLNVPHKEPDNLKKTGNLPYELK
jgi:hypothetical protein